VSGHVSTPQGPKRIGRPEEYAKPLVAIVANLMFTGGTIRLDVGQRFAPKWPRASPRPDAGARRGIRSTR